jgi:ATP-dependent RNA helicase RhlE
MSFNNLGLNAALLPLIQKQFSKPYPIQELAIPAIIDGKDILGIAKTGSGKTAAYVLPTLCKTASKPKKNRYIETLVLVPTRELAIQIAEVFNTFEKAFVDPIKVRAVYGGVSINPQMIEMNQVSILIATPGRLLELIEQQAVHISNSSMLIIDEADKLLNLGFQDEMNAIFEQLPKKRQTLLFSATLSKDVSLISDKVCNNPEVIQVEEDEHVIDLITHSVYIVTEERKGPFLRYLIKSQNFKQVLIFTSSIQRADRVADKLRKNGIEASAIHSSKSQHARTEMLQHFKKGKISVLVATDLIARGIDIEYLPVVINYELPRSPKDYVHRIGRTGRSDNPGEAITILTHDDLHHFNVILKKMKKEAYFHNTDAIDLHGY